MKRFISQLIVIASVIFIAASCQQAPFITMTGPRSFTFTRDGGTQSFSFACNREWSVSSTESWVSVSPSKGSATDGETKVTITCSPNTTYDARSATITVKVAELSETISITQDTGLGLIVSPKSFDLTNAAQTIEIEVQKNVQYSITIDDAGKSWITHTGTKGLSSEKASFSIAANETYDNREAKITFKQTDGALSETVVVKQRQTDGLFITTPEYNLSNDSHTLSVEVNANVEYEVTSQADWIKYVETKALQPSTITLSVAANDIYDTRTGKVIVKQTNGSLVGEIIVNQAEKYGLFVSPEEVIISKDAQTIDVEVKYNVEYDIIIPDGAKEWVSIQAEPNTKGLKDETVSFAVAENAKYFEREVAIAFKQKDGDLTGTIKIVQAQTDYLSISPQKETVSYEGGVVYLSIITNIPYSLELVKTVDWATIGEKKTKGTELGLTTFVYPIDTKENTSIEERSAIINIKLSNGDIVTSFELTQEGVPIVNFADKYAKIKCVDKFDINNDGEVSIIEAKVVTSFPEDFFGEYSNIVSSFDEFQYFGVEKTYHTFFSCTNLRSIVLPSTLKELGAMTFYGCSSLKQIVVPKNVTVFGDYVFACCSNLVSVSLPSQITSWGECMFMECTKINNIVLPSGITSLGTASFAQCKQLEQIVIPSGVITLGENAFRGCTSLANISFPNSLLSIGNQSFSYCTSLENVVLSEGLIVISDKAFFQCDKLSSITIPNSVTSIGSNAFNACPMIANVYLKCPPGTITYCGDNLFSSDVYNVATLHIKKGLTKEDYEGTDFSSFTNIEADLN